MQPDPTMPETGLIHILPFTDLIISLTFLQLTVTWFGATVFWEGIHDGYSDSFKKWIRVGSWICAIGLAITSFVKVIHQLNVLVALSREEPTAPPCNCTSLRSPTETLQTPSMVNNITINRRYDDLGEVEPRHGGVWFNVHSDEITMVLKVFDKLWLFFALFAN